MATFAARRLSEMAKNTEYVIAIEWLGAAQAVEYHHPHATSTVLRRVLDELRRAVPRYHRDRFFAPDIDAAQRLIEDGYFYPLLQDILPSGVDRS